MIQNSLSPVVKSRISSSSGSTISVEKRSLARTGTMSSFAYFTTRAAASVAARAPDGNQRAAALQAMKIKPQEDCVYHGRSHFIDLLLWKEFPCFVRDFAGDRETSHRARRRPKRYDKQRLAQRHTRGQQRVHEQRGIRAISQIGIKVMADLPPALRGLSRSHRPRRLPSVYGCRRDRWYRASSSWDRRSGSRPWRAPAS